MNGGPHLSSVPTGLNPTHTSQSDASQDDHYITTFFCRALYDYQTQDTSSLSFHKNDIIEVLTQLESGWWDGLLGDERGWFPSNYVTVISDDEAEAALSGSEFSPQTPDIHSDSVVDFRHALARDSSSTEQEWMIEDELAERNANSIAQERTEITNTMSQPNDFWMPQVNSAGQVRSRNFAFLPS